MSHIDPATGGTHQESPPAAGGEQHPPSMHASRELSESLTSSVLEFGGWIFGGLIGFDGLVLSAIITVGPVDPAITASTTAGALALPLTLAGLLLLRLEQDWRRDRSEAELAQAYRDVGSVVGSVVGGPAPSPAELRAWRKRRIGSVLRSSLWLLALSGLLSLICLSAVLWHMAWWIAVVFLAMVVISLGSVVAALGASPDRDSGAGHARRRRYWEALRQARARSRTNAARSEPPRRSSL